MVSNSMVDTSRARSWISSWTWSTVISCIRLKYGSASFKKASPSSVRAGRGSGSPAATAARSASGSTGSRLSQ